MKKQALTFFTMFSLIMMLSIYYISLPNEVSTQVSSIPVMQEEEDPQVQNEQNQKEMNDEIIADESSTQEEKVEALAKNDTLDENNGLEEEVKQAIINLGYECEVEIKEQSIYVNILNQEEDASIISMIMKEIHRSVGTQYLMEIKFT